MSKLDRIYAVIAWAGLTRGNFTTARGQGLFGEAVNCSFDTARKSLDGTKAIVWWRGTRPGAITAGRVLFAGTLEEVSAFIETNNAEWVTEREAGVPVVPVLATSAVVEKFRADIVEPAKPKTDWRVPVAWAAAAVAAGAAASHFLGVF